VTNDPTDPKYVEQNEVTIQVDDHHLALIPGLIPPVGQRIQIHKHLTPHGNGRYVEVVGHEWHVEEPLSDGGLPRLVVRLKTITIRT
jgi:hypothetical protein